LRCFEYFSDETLLASDLYNRISIDIREAFYEGNFAPAIKGGLLSVGPSAVIASRSRQLHTLVILSIVAQNDSDGPDYHPKKSRGIEIIAPQKQTETASHTRQPLNDSFDTNIMPGMPPCMVQTEYVINQLHYFYDESLKALRITSRQFSFCDLPHGYLQHPIDLGFVLF
jgi:hypothetical protein